MKQFILSCTAVICLFAACNNNKKTVEEKSEDGKEKVSADLKQTQQVTEEMKKTADELQGLPPLSPDELKALLPESVMGTKRTSFEATSVSGTGYATAEYNLNDSTEIKVNIWDCGGPAGAGFYSMQYLAMFNFQPEKEHEYTKTIDFKGEKAIEHCNDESNRCSLTYFGGKRFMVTIEGRNVHPDGLKQTANELKI